MAPVQGLMLEDMMAKEAPSEKGYGSATFLGLCRHASSPCVRRIDLKWYPRRSTQPHHLTARPQT